MADKKGFYIRVKDELVEVTQEVYASSAIPSTRACSASA